MIQEVKFFVAKFTFRVLSIYLEKFTHLFMRFSEFCCRAKKTLTHWFIKV